VGYASRKLRPDPIHHPVDVIPHSFIGEAQGPVAFAQKHRVTSPIMVPAVFMRLPVHLDDQPASVADKVQEISAKGRLPSKVSALGAQPSEVFP